MVANRMVANRMVSMKYFRIFVIKTPWIFLKVLLFLAEKL